MSWITRTERIIWQCSQCYIDGVLDCLDAFWIIDAECSAGWSLRQCSLNLVAYAECGFLVIGPYIWQYLECYAKNLFALDVA